MTAGNINLGQYVNQYIREIYPSISDYRIVNTTETTLDGNPAQKIIMYDYLNNHTSEFMRLIAIKNGTAYRLGYSADPGKFAAYQSH